MSTRSSMNDDALGERYARTAEETDPFNPNARTDTATHLSKESLFPDEDDDDKNDDTYAANDDGIIVSEGNVVFPQARRERIPQHGHATQATTQIITPGDGSVASSAAPSNSAFVPTFSPPAHNPPPMAVFTTRQEVQTPIQVGYGRIEQGRVHGAQEGAKQ